MPSDLLRDVVYQVYLTQHGGENFILNAPRDTLFSQNREGILSLAGAHSSCRYDEKSASRHSPVIAHKCASNAGYTALYLLSVFTGQVIFSYMDNNGGKAMRNMRWLVISFAAVTLILVVATFISVRLVARPSRRMVRAHRFMPPSMLRVAYLFPDS